MRIFLFNWHTPYTTLLAKTGHDFEVSAWIPQGDGSLGWNTRQRPVPANVKLVENPEDAFSRILKGYYDLVICFTLHDMEFVSKLKVPVIFFAHNSLKVTGQNNLENIISYRETVKNFLNGHQAVFATASPMKLNDWKIPGLIIPPGTDSSEFYEYSGNKAAGLTVMNHIKERYLIADYPSFRAITEELPFRVAGINNGLQHSEEPPDYEALKKMYKDYRVYINATRQPYEDGYNLAMLEAMATGMPMVSLANPTSPLTDGLDGFISGNKEYLKEKIKLLLSNHDLAKEMGNRAKETVIKKFPLKAFIENWNTAFEQVIRK